MTSTILSLDTPQPTMPESISDTKNSLRRDLRARLKSIPAEQLALWSESLCRRLQAGEAGSLAGKKVALFGGMPSEADLRPLIAWLTAHGGVAAYFDFDTDQLLPRRVSSVDQLKRGEFGVWVPEISCPVLAAPELDVVLAPGLAFDRRGGRLGRGRGYFDRFLTAAAPQARRVGICFDCQVVACVPLEAHDARMEMLLTESGCIEIPKEPMT
jgi:5-formyltetrahydrofolate cyclo-ligase